MKEIVKPFQKYTSEKYFCRIDNSLKIGFGNANSYQSSTNFSIQEVENEDFTKNWIVEKIFDESSVLDNSFIEILEQLEKNTYPVTIQVDDRGVFQRAVNHSQCIEDWKIKTNHLQEKYNNVDVFRSQYLVNMEDEESFYKNKLKEPFWNLLLFAPSYINDGSKIEGTIIWNIKGIQDVLCLGLLRAKKKDYGFEASFTSEFIVEDDLKDKINNKTNAKSRQYNIALNIVMEYNSSLKRYLKKDADFKLLDGQNIVYQEICNIK